MLNNGKINFVFLDIILARNLKDIINLYVQYERNYS